MTRDVVVMHESGELLKVCDDWDSFDEWFELFCMYDRSVLNVKSARVYGGADSGGESSIT